MKYKHYSVICLVLGLVVTLALSWMFWNRTQHRFHLVNEKRRDAVVIKYREAMLHHVLMIKAFHSFFKASEQVSEAEFMIFTGDLFKLKSGIAFTLDDKHKLGYISDRKFAPKIAEGTFLAKSGAVPIFQVDDYVTYSLALDSTEMPFLVYLLPHASILQSLNSFDTFCIEYVIGKQVFNNRYCEQHVSSLLGSLFVIQSDLEQMDSPLSDIVYTLTTWSVVSKADIAEICFIMFLVLAIGISCSVLMYLKVEQSFALSNMRVETEAKVAILSTINHEIRTPINAVLGYSKMLKQVGINPKTAQIVNKIIWSANLLQSVAENSLNFSKASTKQLNQDIQDIDLRQMIDDIVGYYSAFSQSHDRELRVKISQQLPASILIDSTKLFQVITNIINNAFKYSSGDHVDCHVSLKQHASKRFVRICVRDFGEGISSSSLAAIAQPFAANLHNSTRSQSGIGIGLYICKKMLDDVGGSIRFLSRTDRGTLVIIRFPYQRIGATNERLELASSHIAPSAALSRQGDIATGAAKSELDFRDKVSKHREKSILLVDDNLFNLEVAKASLEEYGFRVACENNAQSTLEHCHRVMPEILLMDYRLDDTDGLTVIDDLIAQQASSAATAKPSTHYFILSANDKMDIPNYAQYPHVSFLQKPLNVERLLNELERCSQGTRGDGMS